MLQFTVDADACTGCGACARDCRGQIIELVEGRPTIAPANENKCVRCQHCLAVCPTGAVSIFGLDPEDSRLLKGALPAPEALETLVEGRRTVRQYRPDGVDPALIGRLLKTAWAAPTGNNKRTVHFTVIDDPAAMRRFRERAFAALQTVVVKGALPMGAQHFENFLTAWVDRGVDIPFRGAPHLLVAHGPANAPTPVVDGLIALSTFDLLAQAHGLGTVWGGSAFSLINDVAPELKGALGIPEEHAIAYVMMFGYPAVHFVRTVQRGEPPVNRVRG